MARVAGLAGANGSRDLELTSRWLEGKFYQLRGEVERGDSVYGLLLPRLDECDHFLKADIIYDNSYRLEREGKIDSALMLARWYYAQAETIASFGSIRKISNLDSMERLRRYNEGMEKEKRRERLYWIIGAVLLAVIAIFGYRKMRQKVRRERSRKAEAIREMENQVALVERGNRELTSIGLVMTEKDNVLQTLMERISDMEHKQRITREEARYLDSTIRLHRGRQQEWEHFKEIYTELSTDFPDRLRTTYPDLTEGDIKMAMYIRVGMNSRQIANMLNIRPESVKMNRIRLRKRMHLSPDDSLEEVLSRVSSESK